MRVMAMTLLAYAPEFKGVYLIEEPENGIHPTALQAVEGLGCPCAEPQVKAALDGNAREPE